MASPLALLKDERVVRLRTRLIAWWEGKDIEAGGPLVLTEAAIAPPPALSPRVEALAHLWGEGRFGPAEAGQEADWMAALAARTDETLALLSPTGGAQIKAMAGQRKGRLEAYEWRDSQFAPLTQAAARLEGASCSVHPLGIDGAGLKPRLGGLVSNEELAYCPDVAVFAKAVHKALKKGSGAVFETYCTEALDADWSGAFSVADAEPKIRNVLALRTALSQAGFTILSEEDRSRTLANAARAAFARFSASMQENPAILAPAALQELAWESECWRVRLKLLGNGTLLRYRFVTVKPKIAPPPLGSISQARTIVAAH